MNTNKCFSAIIDTPMPGSQLGFFVRDERLVSVEFISPAVTAIPPVTAFALGVAKQFERYFENSRWQFDIDLEVQGTLFQKRVWQALTKIPQGSVRRYGELATALDSSPRAVGNACRVNPLPIIVPCHRVVAANGLGGFMGQRSGDELDIKRWLLRHEGVGSQ